MKEVFSWLKVIVTGVVIAFGVQMFVATPIKVEGASMMPTFENGDRVVVNRIGKQVTDFERFDVVVFKVPSEENYIKRIIGLPGDHIAYEDDVLYINGKKYDEPYLDQYKKELNDPGNLTFDFTLEDTYGISKIPAGSYFVIGDNRRDSYDSRFPTVGLIDEADILGKVSFRYFPVR